MKTIITAAAFAMAAFTTTAAQASSVSDCYTMGDSINMLATVRDNGLSAGVVYEFLTDEGLGGELIVTMIELVYVTGSTVSPNALERMYVDSCINGLGEKT